MISWYSTDFLFLAVAAICTKVKVQIFFIPEKPEPFPGDICGRAKKKKKENRGRLGSSGRKERDLGRMERRTEVWVVLKNEGELRRL